MNRGGLANLNQMWVSTNTANGLMVILCSENSCFAWREPEIVEAIRRGGLPKAGLVFTTLES